MPAPGTFAWWDRCRRRPDQVPAIAPDLAGVAPEAPRRAPAAQITLQSFSVTRIITTPRTMMPLMCTIASIFGFARRRVTIS